MTFQVEHVMSGKRETVTEAQWAKMNKLFPRTFKRIQQPVLQSLSDEAKQIIADAKTESEE